MFNPQEVILHHSENEDGVIQIRQNHSTRALYFASTAKQSAMDLAAPERLVLSYTRAMMSCLLLTPSPNSILLIGLGGGSLARFLLHHFPDCRIDAIERRSEVIKLAYGYFYLPEQQRLNIYHADGYAFLNHQAATFKSYDLILVDAFEHNGVSSSVKNQDFFLRCSRALNEEGTLVLNLWASEIDQFQDTLNHLGRAFDDNLLFLPIQSRDNLIAFAGQNMMQRFKPRRLKALARQLENKMNFEAPEFLDQIRINHRWRRWTRLLRFR
jgi:spermidine synthase